MFTNFSSVIMATKNVDDHSTQELNEAADQVDSKVAKILAEKKELEEQLAKLKRDAAMTVPIPSTDASGPTVNKVPAIPDALKDVDIDWGDMDPQLRRDLCTNPSALAAFMTIHSIGDPSGVQLVGDKLIPSKKRKPEDDTDLPKVEFSAAASSEAHKQLDSYHSNFVQPMFQQSKAYVDAAWLAHSAQWSQMQNNVHNMQQQLSTMHRLQCRRSLIFRNLPAQLQVSSIDKNLGKLLQYAGTSMDTVQTRVNYRMDDKQSMLYVIFTTDAARAAVKNYLSANPFRWTTTQDPWYDEHGNDYKPPKIKVEIPIPASDRIAKQPIFAAIDVFDQCDDASKPFTENVVLIMGSLQVTTPPDQPPALLAQLMYGTRPTGEFIAQLVVNEQHMQLFTDNFPAKFKARMRQSLRQIQIEEAAISQGTTRNVPTWQVTMDPNRNPVYAFPYVLRMITADAATCSNLYDDPWYYHKAHLKMLTWLPSGTTPGQDVSMSESKPPKGKNKGKGKSKNAGQKSSVQEGKSSYSSYSSYSSGSRYSNDQWSNSNEKPGKGKQKQQYFTPDWSSRQWQDWNDGGDHGGHDDSSKGQSSGTTSQWGPSTWQQQGNTRTNQNSGKGNTRQPYRQAAEGNTQNRQPNQQPTTSISTSPSTPNQFATLTAETLQVRLHTFGVFKMLIVGLAWCNTCQEIVGMNSNCKACLPQSWFKCPKPDCFQQLGQNTACAYCKAHYNWCKDYLNRTVTQHLPQVPFQAIFDLVNGLAMAAWHPFDISKSDFHVRAIEEIRLQRTGFFTDEMLKEAEYVFSHVDTSFIEKMVPPYVPIYPTLPQLLAQGDPNRGYPIDDANVANSSQFLELHKVLLQRKFEAEAAQLPWPFGMMDSSEVHTALIPWSAWVHHSLGSFLNYDPSQGFTAQDIETALSEHFSHGVTIDIWISAISNWALSKQHPLRLNLLTMQDPWNKATLKCTGHAGSMFFDSVTMVASHCFGMINPKQQAAANSAFAEIYTRLVTSPHFTIEADFRTSLYSRVENDKGNTMESLTLFLLEDSQHALIWLLVYLVLQISFPTHYKWAYKVL